MLGEYFHAESKLDTKGRLVLPARLRKSLEVAQVKSLVFMCYPKTNALWGFTPSQFATQIEAPLKSRPAFDMMTAKIAHYLLRGATTVDIDNQGRINLPGTPRDRAGLKREIVVRTILDRVEVWDSEGLKAFETSLREEEENLDLSGFPGA